MAGRSSRVCDTHDGDLGGRCYVQWREWGGSTKAGQAVGRTEHGAVVGQEGKVEMGGGSGL